MHCLSSLLVTSGLAIALALGCGQQSPLTVPGAPVAVQSPPTAPAPPAGPKPPQATTGPIRAEPPKVDLGYVAPDALVTATYTLVNPLDVDARITDAATTCQCTGTDVKGKVIPANGKIEIHASMKMTKAPIRKLAAVNMAIDLGTHGKQALKVEIEAEVSFPIRAVPPYIAAEVKKHQPLSGTFRVEAADGKPFHVVTVMGGPPNLVGADPAGGAQTAFTVAYDFTAPGFKIPAYVIVETDREDCPLIDLRVRHESVAIKPPFKISEFRSSFGRISPGATGEFDFEIHEAGTATLDSAASLWPNATVKIVSQKSDGKDLAVHCSVTLAPDVRGVVVFPVQLRLGDKQYSHLVYGTVR